jgi:DNA polymerase elongation subunit (family B)
MPTSTSVQAFSLEDADVVLYGADHTPRLVAVERSGRQDIALFQRQADGSTTIETRRFTPWLLSESADAWRSLPAVADIATLSGNNALRHLVTFHTWDDFRNLTSNIREPESRGDVYFNGSPTGQFQMSTGVTLFKDMVFEDVRRLQLDIETLGLDPTAAEAEIIMVAIRQGDDEDVLVQSEGEAELLERMAARLVALDPDVIEGHNIYSFDLPYIVERARRHGVALPIGRDGSAPQVWANQQRFRAGPMSLPYTAVTIYGRHVVDTLQQIQRHDVQGMLTGYGLKNVIRELGLERSDRTFVQGDDIATMWRRGERQRETLARYALDDVRDVDLLSRVTTPTEFYQSQILPLTYQRSTTTGMGKKIDDMMIRAYLHAGHSVPQPEPTEGFPGGYTAVIRQGVFGPIVKADVESLYPSIMTSRNIAPASDPLGAFLILLRDLLRRRLDAKARVRTSEGEERAKWDALQGSFKILINSFYGYLGFGIGHFNDFEAASRVTLEGQRIIRSVVEELEHADAVPIEVDTDGVYFKPPDHITTEIDEEDFIQRISAGLPPGIRLAHDGRYAHMLSLKMKTYALLDRDGKLTLKGSALRSRRMEKCFLEFIGFTARNLMLGHRDAVRDAYFDLAERIQTRKIDPAEIGQWSMLRRSTADKSPRLSRLLRATQGQWRFGERAVIYEREDGELGLLDNYANDENTSVLLRRLKETANRFAEAFDSPSEFEAFFPTIQVTTNLDAARETEQVEQLGLF